MAHEIPKLILEHADSVADRRSAVETALSLGMPLNEIEEYLDWLDAKNAKIRPEKLNSNLENSDRSASKNQVGR